MVLLASTFDQPKYLRADDLKQPVKLKIKKVTEELIGRGTDREKKPVVWFTTEKRGLVLNKTNLRTLRGAFDDNMEAWAGHVIEVFPTVTEMAGSMTPALRVRIPPPKQAVSSNGREAKLQTTAEMLVAAGKDPPKRPIVEPDDDFDDEIGF